jgi:polyphosphate kinase 2 (PPK2 family)
VEERKFWNRYMQAYEECLSVTSTSAAAWFVGPADDEKSAPLIVPRIPLDALEEFRRAKSVG